MKPEEVKAILKAIIAAGRPAGERSEANDAEIEEAATILSGYARFWNAAQDAAPRGDRGAADLSHLYQQAAAALQGGVK